MVWTYSKTYEFKALGHNYKISDFRFVARTIEIELNEEPLGLRNNLDLNYWTQEILVLRNNAEFLEQSSIIWWVLDRYKSINFEIMTWFWTSVLRLLAQTYSEMEFKIESLSLQSDLELNYYTQKIIISENVEGFIDLMSSGLNLWSYAKSYEFKSLDHASKISVLKLLAKTYCKMELKLES